MSNEHNFKLDYVTTQLFFKPGGPSQLLLEYLQDKKNYHLLPARSTTLWSDHHQHPCLVDTPQSNWLQKLLLLFSFLMSRDVQKPAIHPIQQQGQSSPSEHCDEDSFPGVKTKVCFTQIEGSVMIQQYWVGTAASLRQCTTCTSNIRYQAHLQRRTSLNIQDTLTTDYL